MQDPLVILPPLDISDTRLATETRDIQYIASYIDPIMSYDGTYRRYDYYAVVSPTRVKKKHNEILLVASSQWSKPGAPLIFGFELQFLMDSLQTGATDPTSFAFVRCLEEGYTKYWLELPHPPTKLLLTSHPGCKHRYSFLKS